MMKIKKWSGKPIAMPGIYSDMPLERYHASDACIEPSISSSGLRKIFSESPKHYWATSPYNPKRADGDDTPALTLGRAAHYLLLGEGDFRKHFAVRPDMLNGQKWHGSRLECKGWKREVEASGRTIITSEQAEKIKGIVAALQADPAVQHGCLNGGLELSWFWKDKKTGVWVKYRPDANPTGDLSFVDLKLTTSTDWQSLQYAIRDYGYWMQAGLGAIACEEVLGRPMDSFSLLFVENSEPFDIEFVMFKDSEIKRGQAACRAMIDRFAECLKSGKWPGRRGERAEPRWIELREFDQKKIDDEIKLGASA
jgi:hypothetical protein